MFKILLTALRKASSKKLLKAEQLKFSQWLNISRQILQMEKRTYVVVLKGQRQKWTKCIHLQDNGNNCAAKCFELGC